MQELILVTGATGNVGQEVTRALLERNATVRAAIFDESEEVYPGAEPAHFDFMQPETFGPAFEGVTRLFLMRPPAIGDVEQYLFPVVDQAKAVGIKQIAFLSLMGVERNKSIPHYRVEQYIEEQEVPYTFLRPSYFMQNLNTVYREVIRERDEIFLPAGRGRTSFIDVRDIGDVAALVLTEEGHVNQAYELSGDEALTYYEVAHIISGAVGRRIEYTNPSFDAYSNYLREQGAHEDYIKVQRMLYMPVKLGLAKQTTDTLEDLLGRPPRSFAQYAHDYAHHWNGGTNHG